MPRSAAQTGRVPSFRDERGVALIAAIGIVLVVGIVGALVAHFSDAGFHQAGFQKQDRVAGHLADAGLDSGASVLFSPANTASLLDPALLPADEASAQVVALPEGTVRFWGTLDAGAKRWTIHSSGTASNPAAAGTWIREAGTMEVPLVPLTGSGTNPAFERSCPDVTWTEPIGLPAPVTWDASMPAPTPRVECVEERGGIWYVHIGYTNPGPVPVSIPIGSNNRFVGSDHDRGQPTVFYPGDNGNVMVVPFSSAGTYRWQLAGTEASAAGDAMVPSPSADIVALYSAASPGPASPCATSSGLVPAFDNDAAVNSSNTAVEIFTAASYSCTTAGGSISWDALARTLTVEGIVFFDGRVTMYNAGSITYSGKGSIVANGSFWLTDTKLCAQIDSGTGFCDWSAGAWDPNATILSIVAADRVDYGHNAGFQGVVYTNDIVSFNSCPEYGATIIQGPVVGVLGVWFDSGIEEPFRPFYTIVDIPESVPTLPGVTSGWAPGPPENRRYQRSVV